MGTVVQGTIDLGAYVNVATGQAVAIESVDFIWQIGNDFLGGLSAATNNDCAWAAQLSGLVVVGIFTVVVTTILIKVVGAFTQLRVDEETETNGLDLSVHGERAYDMTS